ncbi:MAG TPA: periplasmic heavy metal sensor [Desulfobacteria bacterium]|nr:periplasmic heavy metal sensor [Desulfobacteria bacterium]
MKKLVTALSVFLLIGFMAYPAFAGGPGWGRGCPGWGAGGGQGGGPGYCWRNQGNNAALSPEQQQKLNTLDQKFFNETSTLRNNIWSKQTEMSLLLNGENPDVEKLRALQKEITELKGQMAEKRLSYTLETRKVAPQATYGGGYGRGRGGFRGNRGGGCWN